MSVQLVPVVFRGQIADGYFFDNSGNIYSDKRGSIKELAVVKGCKHNPYPKIGLRLKDKKQTINIHRLVCETFHEKPLPDILTEEQWSNVPVTERNIILEYIQHADRYQVNHIDHNHKNYHPSNLEWVTASENQQKYQEHKNKGIGNHEN